ncbi:hypothetical protein CYLTODRAFT_6307 [Cylindrobasidium torrendii FP15055 ss-10]|uniref:Uncharacterized protein n=1 Tax=Cylindrobasidium torrendii FP15055 ss-10 TaxID=1314674 RepID=A0A0D7BRH5_9AGAR|nr:hypothetical protein CYLTODRAFT_6307 [Cylindrobasidium torrendii FP15055 ss-10]
MLDLLQAVILPEHVVEARDIVSPVHESRSAERIITTNDEVMQWIWETWDDPRLANVEIITFVTAVHVRQISEERLHTCFRGTHASSSAILRVLFDLVAYFSQYPLDIDDGLSLLMKCSLYILHLLKLEVIRTGPDIIRQRADLCKTLLFVFVLVGSSSIVFRVQRVLLEVFTLFDPKCLEIAAKMAVEDTIGFLNCLNNFLGRDHDLEDIPACLIALNFCTLLRRAHAPDLDVALSRSWAYLLPPILENLLHMPRASMAPTLSSLLFLVSAGTLEHRPQLSSRQNETLWSAALRCGPSDLLVVAGIAVYIVSQDRVDLHSRQYGCRVWDMLRDALFLVLRHRFLDDHEPLGLLTASVICTATEILLRRLDSPFIIASPWTSTLRRELKSLISTQAHEEDHYRRILQIRARESVTHLLSTIEDSGNSLPDEPRVHLDQLEKCMLGSVVSFRMSECVIVIPIAAPKDSGRE